MTAAAPTRNSPPNVHTATDRARSGGSRCAVEGRQHQSSHRARHRLPQPFQRSRDAARDDSGYAGMRRGFPDLASAVLCRAFLRHPTSRRATSRSRPTEGRHENPRRVRQYHVDHDLDPDRGGFGDARRPRRTGPAPRSPNRPPAGSNRWWRSPVASSTAVPRPTSKPSWRVDVSR